MSPDSQKIKGDKKELGNQQSSTRIKGLIPKDNQNKDFKRNTSLHKTYFTTKI